MEVTHRKKERNKAGKTKKEEKKWGVQCIEKS